MKIAVQNPCNENWEAMTQQGNGRSCASCKKVVVDFTSMSDADFVTYFQHFKNNACGRFTEQQLNVELPDKPVSVLPFRKISRYVAASLFAIAGLSVKVFGQEAKTEQTPVLSDSAKTIHKTSVKDDKIVIRGRVLDYNKEGLPGATISIEHTDYITGADLDGNFEIEIPRNAGLKFCELKASYAGYITKTQSVNIYDLPSPITIIFQYNEVEQSYILGDIAVVKATRWMKFKGWFRNNFL